MKYLVNIDMSGNEIQNVVLQPLATEPSGPTVGRIYYDTADHRIKTYNGSSWIGVAELDANGKVPASQLPDYVDDVHFGRFNNDHTTFTEFLDVPPENGGANHVRTVTPTWGHLYIDFFVRNGWIWDGYEYVLVSSDLKLGELPSTAYRGDRGKTAYDHSQLTSGNPHNVTKTDIGLGNVDNKSEATIKSDFAGSIADGDTGFVTGDDVYDALALKMNASLKGAANGVAELDSNGKVPASQLPAYVDDVVEGYYYDSKFYEEVAHTTELTGETGKIYVDLSTEKAYRWGGSAYVEISSSLALGETSSTAYRGDRGKIAYDHSQLTSGNPHNVSKSDVGLGNVNNTSDATKKANFKGSIASGNTGFVTGGDVYNKLVDFSSEVIEQKSGEIAVGSMSCTISLGEYQYYRLLNAWAQDSVTENIVFVDINTSIDNDDARIVTFSIASPASNKIYCYALCKYDNLLGQNTPPEF